MGRARRAVDLAGLMRIGEETLGSKRALADALHVTPTSVTRYFNDTRPQLESLLLLARLTHHSARDVLIAAGRQDVLDLLESSFGSGSAPLGPQLPEEAVQIAQAWLRLSDRDREAVAGMIEMLRTLPKDTAQAVAKTASGPP